MRSRTWPRVLVLLLALWVPVAHAQARTAPVLGAAAESFEHDITDVFDTLVQPPAPAVHRADVAERPAPRPPPPPAVRPCPATPRAPYTAPLLRTVVLRC
ncbi:hypothetical protein ADK64_32085 [Streptomyces sp. MMG1121]|nr:hypothetical protein ADK64_32085 [Streptomyces sp. MMG1121]